MHLNTLSKLAWFKSKASKECFDGKGWCQHSWLVCVINIYLPHEKFSNPFRSMRKKEYFEMNQPKDLTIQLLFKDFETKCEKHFLTTHAKRYGL